MDIRLREFVFEGITYDLCDELDCPISFICIPVACTSLNNPTKYTKLVDCLVAQACDHKYGRCIYLPEYRQVDGGWLGHYNNIINSVKMFDVVIVELIELHFDTNIIRRLIKEIKHIIRDSNKQIIITTYSNDVIGCFYPSDIIRI